MGIIVSDDPALLDMQVIHGFLSGESHWAKGIPFDVVRRAMDNSLCFGAYEEGRQVGFARVVTDRATFGYLADVFVVEAHRGRGISRLLVEAVLAHRDLQGLRRFNLATSSAGGLYAKYGWEPLANPGIHMERYRGDAYLR
ncbi:GNAT family N-acetyltransferase [Noviherbaspirillum galbum]|uniref:GNAT family N-acetyltransferase n=1 Tax=Noviherbaspirillum galbum TaxID=2709383 RepID=A0A6B3SPJ7_9BURK|nr:GNAT family N-acetyltransferase [Noviherbaspirillum galbum]NEX61225.1 GNAT family N-acetyltransferase [Noviherbaspirillum galbum]